MFDNKFWIIHIPVIEKIGYSTFDLNLKPYKNFVSFTRRMQYSNRDRTNRKSETYSYITKNHSSDEVMDEIHFLSFNIYL